jgi:Transposase
MPPTTRVAHLPNLAMRRITDPYPGRAKTDTRDTFITADAARSLPHTLRPVDPGDDALAELDPLVRFDDDLAGEATRTGNRIHAPAHRRHPALKRAITQDRHPSHTGDPAHYGDPTGIRAAGQGKLTTIATTPPRHAPQQPTTDTSNPEPDPQRLDNHIGTHP